MIPKNIANTLSDLERGDTFEARISEDGSDFVTVQEFGVDWVREVGDRNGVLSITRLDTMVENDSYRIFVDDDGRVTITKRWSASDRIVENIALELGTLDSPDYRIVADKNAEGEIVESRLVREDTITAGGPA